MRADYDMISISKWLPVAANLCTVGNLRHFLFAKVISYLFYLCDRRASYYMLYYVTNKPTKEGDRLMWTERGKWRWRQINDAGDKWGQWQRIEDGDS